MYIGDTKNGGLPPRTAPGSRAYAAAVFFCCAVFICAHAYSHLQRMHVVRRESFLYTLPAPLLVLAAGSFRSLVADGFYIKGVLALTDEYASPAARLDFLHRLFGAAVSLDSRLIEAYFFGGLVVADTPDEIRASISFLEKYQIYNSTNWKILYWIGFNYYQLKEYEKAALFYGRAAMCPHAPRFLSTNQAMFFYKAGRPAAGIIYLEGLLSSIADARQAEHIRMKLQWLTAIAFLEKQVGLFTQEYGRLPRSVSELISCGLVARIPDDVFGKGFSINQKTGRVESAL